ncbi:oxygen-dependent protoporphyrinogen oxidase [Saccharopolyspora lacisalsi]|uniref:Coproporphyrinogen III oxidase n=1 Tax=Halosaccharopolyspora lacisalsi TaxID=1000566 RepID=A0A839DXW0_9PSEU|nr:protoporphyrinogen oxidase [Halosaccharopolyspora lacisalsi]MBA8825710.1 oxygen-dependent protoporphyrinogen oxidase [Halosaccharopolyspora lacisalsi]
MAGARVAVVGGGVAGLTAAHRLRRELGPEADIVVLDQADRLGGKLRTVELAGCGYDLGAEAFLARRPEVPRLAAELGLTDELVNPSSASAALRAGGARTRLPAEAVMGIPASAESARHVLSEAGVRAMHAESALEPLRMEGADVSVGRLLRERVGDEVVERLVEPLLGGVYAGTADALGLRATVPSLAAALDAGAESITAAVRAALPTPAPDQQSKPPVFGAFRSGYRTLIDRLSERSSARVRLGLPVRSLERSDGGWRLRVGSATGAELLDVDAVVLAVPAPSARRLLSDVVPAAAEGMGTVELASTVVVGMALPPGTELPDASGVLVARGETHSDGTPFTAKAFTLSDRKWPHLRGSGGEVLLRASVGRGDAAELRVDDDELLRRVRADLAELTGVRAEPVDTAVARWGGGLPQYGVGHLDTVAGIEEAVAGVPGLALAGATLHGVGVPACVATGEAAATEITDHLLARGPVRGGKLGAWRA